MREPIWGDTGYKGPLPQPPRPGFFKGLGGTIKVYFLLALALAVIVGAAYAFVVYFPLLGQLVAPPTPTAPVAVPSPTFTPLPTASPTPQPTASPTPQPSPSPSPTAQPSPSPTPQPSPTPSPTPKPKPSPTPGG